MIRGDRTDSIGTCSLCGYHGPGPRHECKARPHIDANGEFQSDKYPTCPPGKVPLSVKDPTAQDLLWDYAQRRRAVDAEFADDLEHALIAAGYRPQSTKPWGVMDLAGSGWGRFATKQEADDRRVELETGRQEVLYPGDATAQFDTMKVHP